jgi:UrcA family protein
MKIRTTRNTVIATAAFTLLCGLSAASHAIVSNEAYETQRVTYTNQDLQQEEGRKDLYYRLKRAAENVCDTEYSRVDERECEKEALERAVKDVDNEAVSALHRS